MDDKFRCTDCGKIAMKNDKFCMLCGGKVEKRKADKENYCMDCGEKADQSHKFCRLCGGKTDKQKMDAVLDSELNGELSEHDELDRDADRIVKDWINLNAPADYSTDAEKRVYIESLKNHPYTTLTNKRDGESLGQYKSRMENIEGLEKKYKNRLESIAIDREKKAVKKVVRKVAVKTSRYLIITLLIFFAMAYNFLGMGIFGLPQWPLWLLGLSIIFLVRTNKKR